jgi:hypothetical protein
MGIALTGSLDAAAQRLQAIFDQAVQRKRGLGQPLSDFEQWWAAAAASAKTRSAPGSDGQARKGFSARAPQSPLPEVPELVDSSPDPEPFGSAGSRKPRSSPLAPLAGLIEPEEDLLAPSYRSVDETARLAALQFDQSGPGRIANALDSIWPLSLELWHAFQARNIAEATEQDAAVAQTFDGWQLDAARHAALSYELARRIGGDAAKRWTDAHEVSGGNTPGSRLMDLTNNSIGRALAMDPRNAGRSARDVALDALQSAQLQMRPFKFK